MKLRIFAIAFWAWVAGLGMISTADAASIVIDNQVTGPTFSVRQPSEPIPAGNELRLINLSNHGIQIKIGHSLMSIFIPALSSSAVKLDQAGTHPFTVYYGDAQGLTSPTVPATSQGELKVQ